jgi:hypothetical protein
MTGDYMLTWKRNRQTGNFQATDDRASQPVTYIVGRDQGAGSGREWRLTAHVPALLQQTRDGFSTRFVAQQAALATRCHLCSRRMPFADTERPGRVTGHARDLAGWICRDRDACAAVAAERDAASRQQFLEIRNTDLEEITIRDTADGPELIFRSEEGAANVIRCTDTDLERLARTIARRNLNRAMADIRDEIVQCDAMIAAHEARS